MNGLKKQQERTSNLLQLIEQNPGLEIMPLVDYECVLGDDFRYWGAEWGESRVDEYYCPDETIYFKENNFDDLVDQYIDDNFEDYPNLSDEELEKLAKEKVSGYEWKKVIVVYIKPLS
jgi:hypothetical protein